MAVQVIFYPSARQRLPLALAFVTALPVALDPLKRKRKSVAFSILGVGILLLGAITWMSGGWAAEQDAAFFTSPGADANPAGIRLASLFDGSAFHPEIRTALTTLNEGTRLYRTGQWDQAERLLEPLANGRITRARRFRGRASYWLAKCYLARRQMDSTRAMADSAKVLQPDDLRTQALNTVLSDTGDPVALGRNWRPPGYDEISARMALAREVSFTWRREAAREIALPVAKSFPEIRGISWP